MAIFVFLLLKVSNFHLDISFVILLILFVFVFLYMLTYLLDYLDLMILTLLP